MGLMILGLWPAEILHLLFGLPLLAEAARVLFSLYLALSLIVMGLGNRLLALAIMAVTGLLVAADENWTRLWQATDSALVFAAFLPTVHLLRNVAARDPYLLAYRARFAAVEPKDRPAWLLIGGHVLGGVLTVGAFAVLVPVIPRSAPPAYRRSAALAVVSGVSLAILWSPFFVAMAVVSEFMSHVPLWQPLLLGIALAVVGLVSAMLVVGVPIRPRLIVEAVAALRRILPLVLVAAAAVVVLRGVAPLTTLEAACLALPPLCLLAMVRRDSFAWRRVVVGTRRSLDGLSAEISIVALAFILGSVMRASPQVGHVGDLVAALNVPGGLLVPLIVIGIAGAASLSIHPMVAASVMLAVIGGSAMPLSDLVFMGAILLGWACGAMVAVAGLIMIVAASMFGVPRRDLVLGRNLVLVLLFGATGSILLALLDAAT